LNPIPFIPPYVRERITWVWKRRSSLNKRLIRRKSLVMECQIEVNKAKCPCTYEPCSRKGKCCDCISYHLELGELPGCVFPPEVEKTYDRSIARFVEVFAYKARSGRGA